MMRWRAQTFIRWCLLLTLSITALTGDALAQTFTPSSRGRGAMQVKPLSDEEGAKQLDAFRRQRVSSDYVFRFELVHYPRRGDKVRYEGCLWGSWNEKGPISRIVIWDHSGSQDPAIDMIVQNGETPTVWIAGENGRAVEMTKEQMREPVLKGIIFTPFDLLMPFIYWQDYEYGGSERRSGRPHDVFNMIPPAGWDAIAPDLQYVSITLDRNFRALNRVEEIGRDGKSMRTFKVVSYKEVGDQYIVKEIDLVDEKSHDKTRFVVLAAAVDVRLPRTTFDPRAIGLGLPSIQGLPFKSI